MMNTKQMMKLIKTILLITIMSFSSCFVYAQEEETESSTNLENTEEYTEEEEYFDEELKSEYLDRLDSAKFRWGGFFNYGLNLNNADFVHLPNTFSCCANYGWAITPGFSLGALVEIPFTQEFRLGLRGGFNQMNTKHTVAKKTIFIRDGVPFDGEVEHLLDARLAGISIDVLPTYRVWKNLFVDAGAKLTLLVHDKFKQIETIKSPNDPNIYFEENGLKYRNYYHGDIPDLNAMLIHASIGAHYDFTLGSKKSWIISPEVSYSFGLNSLVSGVDWSSHLVRGGISIKYQAPPPPPPPPTLPIAPEMPELPEPVPPAQLAASVSVTQLDSLGNKSDNLELTIEDFVSLNMRPLLNYVFFDINSAEIPNRYILANKEEAANFSEENLKDMDVLPTYYYVYNIIGSRMQKYPNATITLTGTNSNEGVEQNNTELSKRRAETVKEYFVNNWNIAPERINIKYGNLPSEPSNASEVGGNEENRRVEITSDEPNITEPVLTIDTLRSIPTTTIVFRPSVESDAGIKSWQLNIMQAGQVIKSFSGNDELPDSMNWVIEEKSKNVPTKGGNLVYALEVTDKIGNTYTTEPQQIKVDQLTIDKKRVEGIADKEFEFYSLILFDYGKSKLGTEHKKTADFVKKRITDKSIVSIVGYTDSMGGEAVNKKISTARANEFAKSIKISNASIYGVGEEELLYNNELPEGRFYCRTVKINIETPIEN